MKDVTANTILAFLFLLVAKLGIQMQNAINIFPRQRMKGMRLKSNFHTIKKARYARENSTGKLKSKISANLRKTVMFTSTLPVNWHIFL